MKKWNNPELMILGVENTREYLDCDCGSVIIPNLYNGNSNNNHHYCHNKDGHQGNTGHGGNDGQGNGHFPTGKKCLTHDYCCCLGVS